MVQISFITVTMNNRQTIEPLLDSFAATIGNGISYEYYIIDNCSTDGTTDLIEAKYPWVKLIKTDKVKGFAENNNIGIKRAKGGVIALINPDIVFLPNAVLLIVEYMQKNSDVGVVGPLLLNADRSIQNTARRFLDISTACLRLVTLANDGVQFKRIQQYLKSYDPSRESQCVDWVIGAAMFVQKKALEETGLLDERFFLYIEDQDWCFQMQKKGWKVVYFTKAKLIHDHQRSSARRISKKTVWHVQSILYFLRKNYLQFEKSR